MTLAEDSPKLSPVPALFEDVATANRILFNQGILDAFGHVSARHPADPQKFLLSRNLAPQLVTRDDILTIDLEGRVIDELGRQSYLERFIHAEIYRRRPDVMAIVHSHTASVLPFTISKNAKLCAVCHMAGFICSETPVFEIRDFAGEASDMLIRNSELGARLADCLGAKAVVLMRGHGMTVVGKDVRQAVFRAVYTESNARIQMNAMALGPVVPMTSQEGEAADAANSSQVDRAWSLWAMQAERASAKS